MTNGASPAARTAVLVIPDLAERPFIGGGCCALPAAGVLREELERWPEITRADVDSETGAATLILAAVSFDLEPIHEMLEDLGYAAQRVSSHSVERRFDR